MSQSASDYNSNWAPIAGNPAVSIHYAGQALGQLLTTSSGSTTPWNPPPPIRATDLVLDEDGVHVLVANQRLLLVPKELLEKLEALMRMAVLAGMVCPVGE